LTAKQKKIVFQKKMIICIKQIFKFIVRIMDRTELAKKIYNISHLTGEFLLRSGKISNEYFDKYLFESRPELLDAIAEHIIGILPNDIDALAGLEMGGIPITTALSLKTGIPTVFVRKKAKEYGTRKIAEGMDISGKRLLVVEDVITSGGQVILCVDELRRQGAVVTNAVCVIDRQSGGSQALLDAGIELQPLFLMSELK